MYIIIIIFNAKLAIDLALKLEKKFAISVVLARNDFLDRKPYKADHWRSQFPERCRGPTMSS